MKKRGSALENGISLLGIVVLAVVIVLFFKEFSGFSFTGFAVFFTGNQSDFSAGTYNNTEWQVDRIQLGLGNLSGTYNSKIFDGVNVSVWNNISWSENLRTSLILVVDAQSDVWRSLDSGITWRLVKDDLNGGEGNGGNFLAMDGNKNLFVVEGDDDVWRSTDFGLAWTKVNDDYNGEDQHAQVMVADSSNNLIIIEGDEDVWKSVDSGTSWTKVNGSDFNAGNGNAKAMALAGSTLYVVDAQSDVWSSTNSGTSWSLVKDDYNGGDGNGATFMAVDSSSNLYIIFNQDVWRSTDSGTSWTKVKDNYNGGEGQNAVVADFAGSNFILIEGDEDVWQSTDSGTSWTKINGSDFNAGNGDPFGIATTSVTTDLVFSVRSCSASDCSDASFSGALTNPASETLSVTNNRYFQYRAFFTSDSAVSSSELYNLSIDYNAYVDSDAPAVSLISPEHRAGVMRGNVTLNYNVTDASSISNCSLSLDGSINQTISSIARNETQNFTLINLPRGNYQWSVSCTDSYNNVGNSETWRFHVVRMGRFGGITTNLSQVNVSNIQNFILDESNAGRINFSAAVDLSGGADIDTYANISGNRIDIDSGNLQALNKSALLYFYNLSYTDPRPLRNGEPCPSSICTEVSYQGGEFIFNVTSFSTYSSEETPSGDSGTSGSTGGGNNRESEEELLPGQQQEACAESWRCDAWSACAGGKQARNCWDFYRCGTREKAPPTSRACEEEEKAPPKETSPGTGEQQQTQQEITGRGIRGITSFITLTLGKMGGATAFTILILFAIAIYLVYRYKINHPKRGASARYVEIPRSRLDK